MTSVEIIKRISRFLVIKLNIFFFWLLRPVIMSVIHSFPLYKPSHFRTFPVLFSLRVNGLIPYSTLSLVLFRYDYKGFIIDIEEFIERLLSVLTVVFPRPGPDVWFRYTKVETSLAKSLTFLSVPTFYPFSWSK